MKHSGSAASAGFPTHFVARLEVADLGAERAEHVEVFDVLVEDDDHIDRGEIVALLHRPLDDMVDGRIELGHRCVDIRDLDTDVSEVGDEIGVFGDTGVSHELEVPVEDLLHLVMAQPSRDFTREPLSDPVDLVRHVEHHQCRLGIEVARHTPDSTHCDDGDDDRRNNDDQDGEHAYPRTTRGVFTPPTLGVTMGEAAGGSTHYWSNAAAEVHKVVVGPMDNNVFIVRCRETGDAALIDAANEHDMLLDLCKTLGVNQVLETHGHWDHIQAVPQMRDAGYEVAVTAADADMLPSYDLVIDDDSVIEVGKLHLHTILTPGHTPGSICFRLAEAPLLFSGDTLFPGGPGATNYDGGDFDAIIESIEQRLFRTLDPDTIVLPGHGDDTTIGAEQPSLDEWVARGW